MNRKFRQLFRVFFSAFTRSPPLLLPHLLLQFLYSILCEMCVWPASTDRLIGESFINCQLMMIVANYTRIESRERKKI